MKKNSFLLLVLIFIIFSNLLYSNDKEDIKNREQTIKRAKYYDHLMNDKLENSLEFRGKNISLVLIELGKETNIESIAYASANKFYSWIYLPKDFLIISAYEAIGTQMAYKSLITKRGIVYLYNEPNINPEREENIEKYGKEKKIEVILEKDVENIFDYLKEKYKDKYAIALYRHMHKEDFVKTKGEKIELILLKDTIYYGLNHDQSCHNH